MDIALRYAIHERYNKLMWKCIHEAGLSKDKSAEAVGYLAVEAAAKKLDFSKNDGEMFVFMRRTIEGYLKNYKYKEYIAKGFTGNHIQQPIIMISGDSIVSTKGGGESQETVFSIIEDVPFLESEENDRLYEKIKEIIFRLKDEVLKKWIILAIKHKYNKSAIAKDWYSIGEIPKSAIERHGGAEAAMKAGVSDQYLRDLMMKKQRLCNRIFAEVL